MPPKRIIASGDVGGLQASWYILPLHVTFLLFLRQENNKILRCLKLCENYNFERRYWLQVIYDVVVSCGEIGPQKLMIMSLYIHLTETETLCDLVILTRGTNNYPIVKITCDCDRKSNQ